MKIIYLLLVGCHYALECTPGSQDLLKDPFFGIKDSKSFLKVDSKSELDQIVQIANDLANAGVKMVYKYKSCVVIDGKYYLDIAGFSDFTLSVSQGTPLGNLFSSILDGFEDLVKNAKGFFLKKIDDGAFLMDPRTDQVILSGRHIEKGKSSLTCFDERERKEREKKKNESETLKEVKDLEGHICILQMLINSKHKAYYFTPNYSDFKTDRVQAEKDEAALLRAIEGFRLDFKPTSRGYIYQSKLMAKNPLYLPVDDQKEFLTIKETDQSMKIIIEVHQEPKRTLYIDQKNLNSVISVFVCVNFANCVPVQQLQEGKMFLSAPSEGMSYQVTAKIEEVSGYKYEKMQIYIIVYEIKSDDLGTSYPDPIQIFFDDSKPTFDLCFVDEKFKIATFGDGFKYIYQRAKDFDEYRPQSLIINGNNFFQLPIDARLGETSSYNNPCEVFRVDSRLVLRNYPQNYHYFKKNPNTNSFDLIEFGMKIGGVTNIIKISDEIKPKSVLVTTDGSKLLIKTIDASGTFRAQKLLNIKSFTLSDGLNKLLPEYYITKKSSDVRNQEYGHLYDVSHIQNPILLKGDSKNQDDYKVASYPYTDFSYHEKITSIPQHRMYFVVNFQEKTLTIFFCYYYSSEKKCKLVIENYELDQDSEKMGLDLPPFFGLAKITLGGITDFIRLDDHYMIKILNIKVTEVDKNIWNWRGCLRRYGPNDKSLKIDITNQTSLIAFFGLGCKTLDVLPDICGVEKFASISEEACKNRILV